MLSTLFFDRVNTWVHPTYDARNAMVLNASNNVAILCHRVSYNPMASCNDWECLSEMACCRTLKKTWVKHNCITSCMLIKHLKFLFASFFSLKKNKMDKLIWPLALPDQPMFTVQRQKEREAILICIETPEKWGPGSPCLRYRFVCLSDHAQTFLLGDDNIVVFLFI